MRVHDAVPQPMNLALKRRRCCCSMKTMTTFSRLACSLRGAGFALAALAAPLTNAATVWSGSLTNYTQPAPFNSSKAASSQLANVDPLTAKVWLTRAATEGLFNAVDESSYDKPSDTDPSDTEWSYGELANYASLTYTTWAAMSGNHPPSMVGQNAVLHLITDDIYLSVNFTAWGGGSGGFAYKRSTPAVVAPAPTVAITNPVGGAVFSAPANVKMAASASVSSGTVTNVTFYNGAIELGSATAPPFGITASNLAANSYALTAVAAAGGVFATSTVVNISVVSPVAVSNSGPAISGGRFLFDYTANAGLAYVVESSTNLVNWAPIATNVATNSLIIFKDTTGLSARRFYQVVRQPNP